MPSAGSADQAATAGNANTLGNLGPEAFLKSGQLVSNAVADVDNQEFLELISVPGLATISYQCLDDNGGRLRLRNTSGGFLSLMRGDSDGGSHVAIGENALGVDGTNDSDNTAAESVALVSTWTVSNATGRATIVAAQNYDDDLIGNDECSFQATALVG